ncbi:MAG: hypothetical protein RI910_1074 [Verrucomicrobiota bacterium]
MVVAMASPFHYQEPFPLGPDTTKYRLLTKEHVSVAEFDGKPVLKVAPEALTLLANQALHDINFHLRTEHLEQVAAILADKEASDNDRAVALAMLRNAEVAAKGVLPFRSGPAATTPKPSPSASIRPTRRITCATRSSPRSISTPKRIPVRICRTRRPRPS